MHHHEIAKLDGKQKFHWWRWLAFWKYNSQGPKLAISWWIAWTFSWGSALFTLGSAASLSYNVCLGFKPFDSLLYSVFQSSWYVKLQSFDFLTLGYAVAYES